MTDSGGRRIDQLRRSLDAVDALIGAIRAEQWTGGTPCDEWDVGRLVNHMTGMNRVFASMLAGDPPPQREDLASEDLPNAFRDSAETLLTAFSEPGVLDRSYSGPLGSATGSDRLMIRMYDLLAHGWDLAVATGQSAQLPEDAAADCLSFVREQLGDDARAGRFGPAQNVANNAPAIERLVAFLGRRLA